MQLTFLGTSAMVPTKERNHSSFFLSYKAHGLLFDCGEGIQRQMKIAGIPFSKINKILLTHWHGDHVLGLPGILQSMSASNYLNALEIYGPKGSKRQVGDMLRAFPFDQTFDIKVNEVWQGTFFKGKDFSLTAMPLKHKIPCVGYAFVENDRRKINIDAVKKLGIPQGPLLGQLQDGKTINFKGGKISPDKTTTLIKGKKIVFITDTMLVENCYKLSENADLLISESTFTSELKDKVSDTLHLTAQEAGLIASKSNVKKLVLTHFSARYKNTQEIEEDARTVFDNVVCAKDFMRVNV